MIWFIQKKQLYIYVTISTGFIPFDKKGTSLHRREEMKYEKPIVEIVELSSVANVITASIEDGDGETGEMF